MPVYILKNYFRLDGNLFHKIKKYQIYKKTSKSTQTKYFWVFFYVPLFLGGMVKAGVKRSEGLAPKFASNTYRKRTMYQLEELGGSAGTIACPSRAT